ncbi:hypothetical protein BN1708_005463 [Verticillium longisporum]|uniref:Uncharacterized protein n=1 Tax=Verticillium longisporum TaxID=100787 RepID=A0A0G4MBF2_VERLO|nr:hypothetical protein BN1708_005463 [Verticillium longisporum]
MAHRVHRHYETSTSPSHEIHHDTSVILSHHQSLQALDLHLDGARLGVLGRVECLERILEVEPVRDQLGEVDDAALDETDGARPRVAVPVLQLNVNLLDARAHKGNVDLVLADTNDEDLAAKLARPDGRGDAALDARALERNGRLDAAKRLDDGLGRVLGRRALDLVRDDRGAELLGESEATLVNVGDDERRGARGAAAKERDEADGTGAADEDGVAEANASALHAGEGDAQGLKHGAVLVRHVADLVAPDGRMVDVSPQQAGHGRRRKELDLLTAVVTPREAGLAGVADDVGLDGDAVADLEVLDAGVHCDDIAGRLVTENVVALDNHGADAAMAPEVNVRAGRVSLFLLGLAVF